MPTNDRVFETGIQPHQLKRILRIGLVPPSAVKSGSAKRQLSNDFGTFPDCWCSIALVALDEALTKLAMTDKTVRRFFASSRPSVGLCAGLVASGNSMQTGRKR